MIISLKEFLIKKEPLMISNKYTINIDITKEEFIKNIEYLFNNILYKIYLYNKPAVINNNIEYKNIVIAPFLIHNNKEAIRIHLYLEAWTYLGVYLKKPRINKFEKNESSDYSKEQLDIINYKKGSQLIISSAGSGKTRTLIGTINNLLLNKIDPKEILVFTYNNKAKEEIVNRLNNHDIDIFTYHSFGDKIIRENTTMYFSDDENNLKNIIWQIIDRKEYSYLNNENVVNDLASLINDIKNNLTEISKKTYTFNNKKLDIATFFNQYLDHFSKQDTYDYHDMIYLTILLFLKEPVLRNYYQNKYTYILVDEYQDINESQKLLLRILSSPFFNTVVFGDDDQTIYSFRGSNVKNIINYRYEYPFPKIKYLSTNYRSKKVLVNNSKKLIDNNIVRFDKNITSFSNQKGTVLIKEFKTMFEQLEYIIETVKYKDSIILYRYQRDGDILELFLVINGLSNNQELYTRLVEIKSNNYFDIKINKMLKDIMSYEYFKKYLDNKLTKMIKNIQHYTIHKTKGKEFDRVLLFNISDIKEHADVEEERRVFYVAITRAKSSLIMTKLSIVNNLFIKEYFLEPKLNNYSYKELINRKKIIIKELWEDKNLIMLMKRDIDKIEQFIVSDSNIYYKNKRNNLDSMNKKYNYKKESLKEIRTEIYYRKLLNCKN